MSGVGYGWAKKKSIIHLTLVYTSLCLQRFSYCLIACAMLLLGPCRKWGTRVARIEWKMIVLIRNLSRCLTIDISSISFAAYCFGVANSSFFLPLTSVDWLQRRSSRNSPSSDCLVQATWLQRSSARSSNGDNHRSNALSSCWSKTNACCSARQSSANAALSRYHCR